jgi:putative ABC transport system ATP-binding protein
VFQLFERLVDEGKTILMVTHDRALADRTGRRIELLDGRVVAVSDGPSVQANGASLAGTGAHHV